MKDPFSFQSNPYFIGFGQLFDKIEQQIKDASSPKQTLGYPPFNLIKKAEGQYVLEMAVAGFDKSEIEVTLDEGKGVLTIKGNTSSTEENTNDQYIFRGLSSRAFTREFNVSDKLVVKDATILNGVLRVWLDAAVEAQKLLRFDIKDGAAPPASEKSETVG